MCTHVDVENIPTQQITTAMTTVRAASTSLPHDCVCPLRASRATGSVQGQVQDARVTGRFEAARTSAAASAASAAGAGSDHSPLQPTGASHSYAPGSTGAAQTMAWLHVHYPGVIGENFENPIGLELSSAATTARAHLVSSQPTGDHSAAL